MANYNITMVYLGQYADIDPTEGNSVSESPNTLLGTYTGFDLVEAVEVDGDNNMGIMDNEYASSANDRVEYDLGSGPISVQQDSANLYEAAITLADGSTITLNVNIRQMVNGDVFMSSNTGLDNLDIRGIELLSVTNVNYSGTGVNQSVDNATVCFARGTRIATPDGMRKIETLDPGDLVFNGDGAALRAVWIGRRHLARAGKNAPIVIQPGALGPGCPARVLRISPQHRLLVRSPIVRRMFGGDAVLVAAKWLTAVPGIDQAVPDEAVDYVHLLCATHEVVRAENVLSETLYLGTETRAILGAGMFRGCGPAQDAPASGGTMVPAHPFVSPQDARRLVARHVLNAKPLQQMSVSAVDAGERALPGQNAAKAARFVQ